MLYEYLTRTPQQTPRSLNSRLETGLNGTSRLAIVTPALYFWGQHLPGTIMIVRCAEEEYHESWKGLACYVLRM